MSENPSHTKRGLRPGDLGVCIQVPYSAIYGRSLSIEEIAHRLWQLPKLDALHALAYLNTLLETAGAEWAARSRRIVEELPECSVRYRFERYMRRQSYPESIAPIHPLQILAAQTGV